MKDKDTGLMEKQIFSEEDIQNENEQTAEKHKATKKLVNRLPTLEDLTNLFSRSTQLIKSPKIFVILGLLIVILVSFIALVSLSTNTHEPAKTVTTVNDPSPTSILDTEVENLEKQVEIFNSNIDEIDNVTKDLKFPQVNLDISF